MSLKSLKIYLLSIVAEYNGGDLEVAVEAVDSIALPSVPHLHRAVVRPCNSNNSCCLSIITSTMAQSFGCSNDE
jgi:hypothetical protein